MTALAPSARRPETQGLRQPRYPLLLGVHLLLLGMAKGDCNYQYLGRNFSVEAVVNRDMGMWPLHGLPKLTWLLAGWLFWLPLQAAPGAQETSWDALFNSARAAEQQGKKAEAESLYLSLVYKAEALNPQGAELARGLESLGMFYFGQGRPAQAETPLRRALVIRVKLGGPQDFEFKRTRSNLASLLQAQGKDSEAEKIYLDAVDEAKKSGNEDLLLAESLEDLGGFYAGRAEFQDAEPLYIRALQIRRKLSGSDDANLTAPLTNLILLYSNQREFSRAEPPWSRKSSIWSRRRSAQKTQTLCRNFNPRPVSTLRRASILRQKRFSSEHWPSKQR